MRLFSVVRENGRNVTLLHLIRDERYGGWLTVDIYCFIFKTYCTLKLYAILNGEPVYFIQVWCNKTVIVRPSHKAT